MAIWRVLKWRGMSWAKWRVCASRARLSGPQIQRNSSRKPCVLHDASELVLNLACKNTTYNNGPNFVAIPTCPKFNNDTNNYQEMMVKKIDLLSHMAILGTIYQISGV